MSLLPCKRCGRTDPRQMIGLMTLWFGRFLELPLEGGYFYLCPTCYEEIVAPHLEDIRQQVLEVHPQLRRHLEEERRMAEREPRLYGRRPAVADPAPPKGTGPLPDDGPEEGGSQPPPDPPEA